MTRAENVFHGLLSGITEGYLKVTDHIGETREYGVRGSDITAHMIIHDPRFYKRIVRDGSLGLGESYMESWWEVEKDDVMSLISIMFMNKINENAKMNLFLRLWVLQQRWLTAATRSLSKRNVVRHYDVGNDLYELFLDENMSYTCGYQKFPSDTIEQMQDQKHDRICRKMQLKEGEHIADLGCGFGSMLIYAAQNYGITGVGVTLSEEQVKWGTQKIKEIGLQDKIRVEVKDYRDLEGTFDKVVSIGLIEHVATEGYTFFMKKVASLLPNGGITLLHTEGNTVDPRFNTDPWINKHIFPGGRLARLEELTKAARQADLQVAHIENLKLHYAETLKLWDEKFKRNLDKIKALGQYDEVFLRMWHYYLQACEAGFRNSSLNLNQLLCTKDIHWTLPMQLDFEDSIAVTVALPTIEKEVASLHA